MAEAAPTGKAAGDIRVTVGAAVAALEVWQLRDGRAAYFAGASALSSGQPGTFKADGQVVLPKTAGVAFLDGGRAYWDHSANAVYFRKVDDRDFYLGRFVGDAASGDTTCTVNLNVDPAYDYDLLDDPFATAIVGTQALGGLALSRRGGALNLVLSATNEAQKVDALGKNGFATGAKAIVELAWAVVSDGAGTVVDFNLGIASGTHATDADAIAQHLFMHLDANVTNINFQSKDGTTTVAATDSTTDYVEGSTNRKEVWFDMRTPADVQVYVDGVNVLPASVFNVSAGAPVWRLLAHLEKTASTDTYEVDVERAQARLAQQ